MNSFEDSGFGMAPLKEEGAAIPQCGTAEQRALARAEREAFAVPALTVGQVIAALRQFDPETPFVVSGYESGFSEALLPRAITLVMSGNGPLSVCGQWDEADYSQGLGEPLPGKHDGEQKIQAVVIER